MSRRSLDIYAERARVIADPLQASARLDFMRPAERLIIPKDLLEKMEISPFDRMLDIGAGIGNISIPMSFFVAEYTVVDHTEVLARMKRRLPEDRITYVPGNFLDVDLKGKTFNKILVYDVLHYLGDLAEVEMFLDKACKLLESPGLILLGDLPSPGFKNRFFTSKQGQEFEKRWEAGRQASGPADTKAKIALVEPKDEKLVEFSDPMLLSIVGALRAAGLQAWIVPQPWGLGMSNQREDILVRRY